MLRVAITGNIASGKSQVEKFIEHAGYTVYDTDKLSHTILENLTDTIIETFKDYNISENGVINRKKLGNIVFNNPDKKSELENIIHPQLKTRLNEIFDENKSQKAVFVSIPLLFEAKMESMFDKVIFVYCSDATRLVRLMARNNLTEKEALARINSQLPQEEKMRNSDFIINNDDDLDKLKTETQNVLQELV